MYVSPDYLRHLFRAEYGEPVIHYLIHRRVEYAKMLLRETDDAVSEIAQASGFHAPYYFSRLFKKLVGYSPTEHRAGSE
ncbi:MAG: helix-turn-helix transcriptional regulator [Spirochaetota bacterium]